MGLRDGRIQVAVNLGSGAADIDLQPYPSGSTFSDDKWHHIKIKRDFKTVSF